MKILVLGSGGREHAIAWKLAREKMVDQIVCAPGNPGAATLGRCVSVDLGNPQEMLGLAAREGVDLTVVGPELPLSAGVVDVFAEKDRAILGPSQAAAALESSKVFAKRFMERHGVPTARFRVCDAAGAALESIARDELGLPLVVKADGLAAGKGVVVAATADEARQAVRDAMLARRFGDAGDRLVLEEFLTGVEASYFALVDGTQFVPLSTAQDHKRAFDGDLGPNTGGMGAFSPSVLVGPELEQRIVTEILQPVLKGMLDEGHPYRGFLYVGLMLTAAGPKVIEFNVRFGDPEAQVVFPRLDEDLSWLLGAASTGALTSRAARFAPDAHVGVVLAASGYPDRPRTGDVISGVEAAAREPGALVFHAGTSRRGADLVTAGGRVLTIVGRAETYASAIEAAYRAVSHVQFSGLHYRRDIGRKAVERS